MKLRLNIISKFQGLRTRDFDTQEELDAQVALWNESKHWGEPEDYWVTAQKDLLGNISIPAEALQTRVVQVPATLIDAARSYTEYLMPKTVTYSIQDVTREIEDAKEDTKRLARIAWADRLFVELARENAKDIKLGLNTVANVVAAEKRLQDIQTTMQNSSLEIALSKLQALAIPELSAGRKAAFIAKIQAYLAAEI